MNKRYLSIFQMTACALLWSMSGFLIRLTPLNAMAISGVRSLLALLVLGGYLLLKRQKFLFNKQSLRVAVSLSGMLLSFVAANKLTSPANAIILQYSAPIFMLLYCAIFRRQRFSLLDSSTVTLTFLGIALFFIDRISGGGLFGNLVAIGSGMFFAAMLLFSEGISEQTRISGLFFGNLLTAVVGLPFALMPGTVFTAPIAVNLVLLGLFQLGLPYLLYAFAIKRSTPLTCVLLATLEPLLSPVWVYLIVGEAPGRWALWGSVIVILAVTANIALKQKAQASDSASH
ncbi:MAG: DMT family transporter [Bacillota bacterium]